MLEIVDNTKKIKDMYFFFALVFLLHILNSFENLFSKPLNFITIISIAALAFLFSVVFKSVYKRDYSNLLYTYIINNYKYEKSKLGISKKIILYLNNGKRRIIIIENNYQLELFEQVLTKLNIPKYDSKKEINN